jgi:hypothetical protein
MRRQEFSKRLTQIELRIDQKITYHVTFPSVGDTVAYVLSGYKEIKYVPIPGEIAYNVDWGDQLPPVTDEIKRKWIAQLSRDMTETLRQTWAESEHERDQIALKELNRLMPQARKEERF